MRNNGCNAVSTANGRPFDRIASLRNAGNRHWERIWRAMHAWHLRARQRRELRELDDRTLRDIGVSRADADFEARKRFWQP